MTEQTIGTNETKQSILLRNIAVIKSYFDQNPNKIYSVSDSDRSISVSSSPFVNFSIISCDNQETALSRLIKIDPKHAIKFMTMTPLQKSILIPKLEIGRLEKGSNQLKPKIIPIVFTSRFEDNYLSFLQEAKIEQLFGEVEPVSGCGIKKIIIEDRPENTADINIKCTIEMVFENAASLLQENIRRLITTPERKEGFTGEDYRLRLKIGWQVPSDYTNNELIDQDFKDALKECEKQYLLELISHTINFKTNGKITLSIQYQGAIDGFLSDKKADLFEPTNYAKGYSAFSSVKEELEISYLTVKMNARDALLLSIERIKDSKEQEAIERKKSLQEQIDALNKEIALYSNKIKGSIFGSILKRVYNQRMFCIDVPIETFKYWQNNQLNPQTEQRRTEAINAANTGIQSFNNIQYRNNQSQIDPSLGFFDNITNGMNLIPYLPDTSQNFIQTSNIRPIILKNIGKYRYENDGITQTNDDGEFKETSTTQERMNTAQEEAIVSSQEEYVRTNRRDRSLERYRFRRRVQEYRSQQEQISRKEKYVPIHFMRYGDLLDTVLSILNINNSTFGIILGGCKYYNNQTNTFSVYNIADIPISVEHFSNWFFNKCITTQRPQYFIKNFIYESITDLIRPLFGYHDGLGKPLFANYSINFNVITTNKQIFPSKISDAEIDGLLKSSINNGDSAYQYLVVSMDWTSPEFLNYDIKEDLEHGIVHYRIGQTSGILNNVSFEKLDNESLRSARMVGDKLNNAGEILREFYNVKLECEGNPLATNGGFFMVDTRAFGELMPVALKTLGIGGYYITNGIETILTPHKYKMTINGFWQEKNYQDKPHQNTQPISDNLLNTISTIPTFGGGRKIIR